jgi:LytS/YehU family sensor histidine kinase
MITRLSRLLRSSFTEPERQEVTLREELEVLQCYLDIARVRFGDRLTVQLDIHPNALDAVVPRLLLQPIVENALRHGIETSPTPGQIQIIARTLPETLVLEVRDNGVGIAIPSLREGTGLRNTRERLRHRFGSEHRLEIEPLDSGGTVVRLVMPLTLTAPPASNPRDTLRLVRGATAGVR